MTLVCVKKEARADATLNNPTLTKPWERKFQNPSSIPAFQREAVDGGLTGCSESSAGTVADGAGLHNKSGTKQAEANHPRVVLSAAAEGGESN